MAKRKRLISKEKQERWIKEGRGKGEGKDYEPWLRIQDVSSEGFVSRLKGWKTGRPHHLLSRLERSFFFVFDYSTIITDIREQFPLLPLSETLEIAEECGIKHPVIRGTKDPFVLTTDFLLTVKSSAGEIILARTVKPVPKLNDRRKRRRIIEKFEIERRYWQRRRTNWKILTDKEVPIELVQNLDRIHSCRREENISPLTSHDVDHIEALMLPQIIEGRLSLNHIASGCDKQLGLERGKSLTVAYHLIANLRWHVDLNKIIETSKQLVVLNLDELVAAKQRRVG